jgi:hypothetical protein
MMAVGKRYQVFSIKEGKEKNSGSTWVRVGAAFINRDGSMNIYLDALPLEGKLHVRESEKRDSASDERSERGSPGNGSLALEAHGADSMGGH